MSSIYIIRTIDIIRYGGIVFAIDWLLATNYK